MARCHLGPSFKRFYTFGLDQEPFPTELAPIREFFNLETVNSTDLSSVSKAAEQLTKNARTALLQFLRDRNQTCYLLFDNMDKYPIRNEVFTKVISGFLKCINILADCVRNERTGFIPTLRRTRCRFRSNSRYHTATGRDQI